MSVRNALLPPSSPLPLAPLENRDKWMVKRTDPTSVRAILESLESSKKPLRSIVKGVNSTIVDVWIIVNPGHSGPVGGETLWVRPVDSGGNSALGAISNVADGCTITKNGVVYPLTHAVRSVGMSGFFFMLLPNRYIKVVDDSESGWSSVGTWTNKSVFNGVGGKFTYWDAHNSQYRISTSSTDKGIWTFTGLTPGRHLLSDHVGGLTDPANTNQALYTVKRGSNGATIATFPRDLKTQIYPHFDGIAPGTGIEKQHLGYFDLPLGETSITVELTNQSGTGNLVADCLFLESKWRP